MLLETIVDFNYAALIIFIMTAFYVVYRKVYKAYSSQLFLLIVITYAIITLLDILVSTNILPEIPLKVLMFAYYLLKYLVSIVFVIYIITLTNSRVILKKISAKIIFSIPCLITVAFLIVNIFTGAIYYFEGTTYYRGDLIFVFYGLSFVYVIFGLIWLTYNCRLFSKTENFALYSVYVLSLAALFTQYFKDEIIIEMLATSISLLLLNITVERSQMIVDIKTGLKNKSIFKRTINSMFKRKDSHGLVVFYIRNYLVLYDRFEYKEALKKLRYFSDILSKILILDFKYDTYYLENGLFGLIVNDYEETKRFATRLNSAIIKEIETMNLFNIQYTLCSVDIINDFKMASDFHNFMFNFADSVTYDKTVISIDDIKRDVKHNILMKLDNILDNVITNKDIAVEFQPIYDFSEKKYTAIEALARIEDKELGIINADNFVPYAEKKAKMYQIDMIILEKVFSLYRKNKMEMKGIKHLTINLSIQTIANQTFINDLLRLERENNIDKSIIVFEIKERDDVAFDKYDYAAIETLRRLGYALSLDNYGVGCLPVSSLAKVPFTNVKFDNLLSSHCADKDTYIVLDNTVKLFNKLNRKTIFAGVEDEKTAQVIETLKPNYAQGFYYSRPLDLKDLIIFLKKHNEEVEKTIE